ncbi:MAG: LamG-like jellyroll fold domain-containing protein, partial [Eubacteriales bacterium]
GADPDTNGVGNDYKMSNFSLLKANIYASPLSNAQVQEAYDRTFEGYTPVTPKPPTEFDEDNIVLSFAALSDIHQNGNAASEPALKFESALRQLENYNLDLVLAAGDLTDGATVNEINQFKTTYESIFESMPFFYCLGNHDGQSGNTAERFANTFGESYFEIDIDEDEIKKGNRYAVVNGYPFIAVEVFSYYNGSGEASYSAATIEWLETTLARAQEDYPGKPIFLATHAMIYDTAYGSTLPSTGTNWYSKDLIPTLKKYPQIITFSGHIHHPLNDERSIMQTDFTSVGCGSVRYMAIESGYAQTGATTVPTDAQLFSQGLVVQVDKNNNVRFIRMDFYNESEIKEPWVIPGPADDKSHLGVYTKNRSAMATAPSFAGELEVSLTSTGAAFNAKTDFESANDDDLVHHYIVNVYEEDSIVPLKTIKYLTDFYRVPKVEDMRENYSIDIGYLQMGTNYTVTVEAVNSWGKKSEAIIKSFKTDGEKPVENEVDLPDCYADIQFKDGEITDLQDKLSFTINNAKIGIGTYKFGDQTFNAEGMTVSQKGENIYCAFKDIINRNDLINFMGNGFAIEAFYVNRSPSGTQGVACATENGGWGLATSGAGGKPYFIASTGQYFSVYAKNDAPKTELTHVIAVYDTMRGEMRIYINGALDNTTPFTGVFLPGEGNSYKGFYLGADVSADGTGGQFEMTDFSLIDLKLYAKPLNQVQVTKAFEKIDLFFAAPEEPSEPPTEEPTTEEPSEPAADGYDFMEAASSVKINEPVTGESIRVFTTNEALLESNTKWTINVVLALTEGNRYKVVSVATGNGSNFAGTLEEGQILLAVHSSSGNPDDIGIYQNVLGKLAAMALEPDDVVIIEGLDDGEITRIEYRASTPGGESETEDPPPTSDMGFIIFGVIAAIIAVGVVVVKKVK